MFVQGTVSIDDEGEAYGLLQDRLDEGYIGVQNAAKEYMDTFQDTAADEYAVLELELEVGAVPSDDLMDLMYEVAEENDVNPFNVTDEQIEEYMDDNDIEEDEFDEPDVYAELFRNESYTTGTDTPSGVIEDYDMQFVHKGDEDLYLDDVLDEVRDEIDDRADA